MEINKEYKVTYKIIYCDYRCSARSLITCIQCGKYFEDVEETKLMTTDELVDFINRGNCHILKVEKLCG